VNDPRFGKKADPHVRCDLLEERFKQAGIEYPESVLLYELIQGPRGDEVIAILLDVLLELKDEYTITRVLDHLWYSKSEFNGHNVTVVYDRYNSDMIRNYISQNCFQWRIVGIDDWVMKKLRSSGEQSYRACFAGLCYLSKRRDEYRKILVDIFEEFPSSCAYALAEIATADEIDFLRDRLDHVDDYQKEIRTILIQYLKRAVSKTEKRIARLNKPPKKAKQ
jgi:hypothetical protein